MYDSLSNWGFERIYVKILRFTCGGAGRSISGTFSVLLQLDYESSSYFMAWEVTKENLVLNFGILVEESCLFTFSCLFIYIR